MRDLHHSRKDPNPRIPSLSELGGGICLAECFRGSMFLPTRMRLLSSIVFAVMALVLPVAGVQMQFCTVLMAFVEGADGCPAEKEDCCGKKDCSKPADCMVASKLLPNAEKPSPAKLPPVPANWTTLPQPMAFDVPGIPVVGISPAPLRAPPDPPRIYLLQRRLLI